MKNYKVKTLTDKYNSTVKIYPKVIEECLPEGIVGVVANPTLAGTEASLTGLQIGETKYKVGGGKQLYRHIITFASSSDHYTIKTDVINDSDTAFTKESFSAYIKAKGFNDSTKLYPCCGVQNYSSKLLMYYGMFVYGNDTYPTAMNMKSTGEDSSGSMIYASFSDTVIAL